MFESNRIQLRKFSEDDILTYYKWHNDIDVMSSTTLTLDKYSFQDTEKLCRQFIHSSNSKSYIIEEKATHLPIGITSLIHIDSYNRNAECIIDIGKKDYWGQGYGQEALTLLLDYAFLELNLHRLSLRVFSFNDRAVKLYKSLGFQHEGTCKEAIFRNGTWHDIELFALFQRNYK
ncbi:MULTISPECIES: GNAT family N-acetyltransferase [Bacillus]|uniref:N-acetyltransferase n=3 Tax=Bacillus cereus group TaxID=86661 RepID=A0A9X6VXH4_BACCE|nr:MULTISPECIES: GNAT family protein [Bacillus]WIK95373.1 GNAT family protein [Bacillus bombysepticus]CKG17021.1 acetyltransferase [Streptococcus pneumoniae]BCA33823.1 acetyltransferase [Bacillus wiedmannii]ANV69890.1 acetyltransferase [Bacillus thuringiensis]ARX68592.1 GNAT family N-acetyltransferase [Bacillus thuringiensis]